MSSVQLPGVSRVRLPGVIRVQSVGVSTACPAVGRAWPIIVLVSQFRSDQRTRNCSVISLFATMALPFLSKHL